MGERSPRGENPRRGGLPLRDGGKSSYLPLGAGLASLSRLAGGGVLRPLLPIEEGSRARFRGSGDLSLSR
jgi:hypothetical protein